MSKEGEGPLGPAVSPVEERRALQSLLDRYGLTLRGIDHGDGLLLTDRGSYEIRRYSGSWEELQFVAAALAHLEKRGFTAFRRLCPTSDGQPGVPLGTGLFYLVQGEAGRRLDPERRGELGRAAALLAAFHDAGEDLPPLETGDRVRYDRWPGLLEVRHAELQVMRQEAVRSRAEFARLFVEYADDFLEQADRALTGLFAAPLADLRQECAERRQVAHRRFVPRKVRRVAQGLLIDGWAHLALDLPVVDLAAFVAKASGNDPDLAYAFLEAYHDLRPIAEGEWEVLLAWLRFPHEFWRLGHLHFHRHETHRSRLARVIRREVEREVFVETLALQWVSQKLTPAVHAVPPGLASPGPGVPASPDAPRPAGEPTSSEEREATLVNEPEELMAVGFLETGEAQESRDPEEPVEVTPEAPPAEEGEIPWLPVIELPTEEVFPEGDEIPLEEPSQEAVVETVPEPAEEVVAETVGEPAEQVLVETTVEIPPMEEAVPEPAPRIIVWRPFPPPLTPRD